VSVNFFLSHNDKLFHQEGSRRRDVMNDSIGKNIGRYSSVVDTKLNPATAAVEKLKVSPQKEFKHMRLLSESNEDFDYAADCNGDCSFDCVENSGCKERIHGPFNMASLSRISESMLKECGKPVDNNAEEHRTVATPTTQLSNYNIKESRNQRRLVSCLAWDSRLAQLDSTA